MFSANTLGEAVQKDPDLPTGAQWFLLNENEAGLAQISRFLEGVNGLEAIHILSHGSDASLLLGSTTVSAANVNDFASELAAIGNALAKNGDLFLYGCNVAQTESGVQFVAELARLTGADVAASSDLTGASRLVGDWVLEKNTGEVAPSWQSAHFAGTMGTSGNDQIIGSDGDDTIFGLEGNDTIYGKDGNDSTFQAERVGFMEIRRLIRRDAGGPGHSWEVRRPEALMRMGV